MVSEKKIIASLEEEVLFQRAEIVALKDDKKRLQDKVDALLKEIDGKNAVLAEDAIEIEDLKVELQSVNETAEILGEENRRMADFCRERSNSERNITPKREHLGYVFKKFGESMDRYKRVIGYEGVTREFSCWEYVLETPYSYQVIKTAKSVLTHIMKTDCLFSRLSIEYLSIAEKDKILDSMFKGEKDFVNYAFGIKLEVNTHTGLWTLSFKTLAQLSRECEEFFNFKK